MSNTTDARVELRQLSFLPRQPGRGVRPTRVALSQPAPGLGCCCKRILDRERTPLQPVISQVVLQILFSTINTHFLKITVTEKTKCASTLRKSQTKMKTGI